jgi:5-methylcytosine-specific restriction endonuclease McrA
MTYLGPDLPLGSLAKPPKREPKPPKRITQRGPHNQEYEYWRDHVAIPYLDAAFGHKCAGCGDINKPLDVDHIKPRGSHRELKMKLTNEQYLCRSCHREKTDHLRTYPAPYEELIL